MAKPRRQDYFAELTGVRAMAAWAVFNYHFNLFSRERFGETIFRLSHEMYLGVNVFYVLSGFLIYFRYSDALIKPRGSFLKEYARNRFARIYPVYFLMLTLGYLATGWPGWRTGLATYSLTQAFFPDLVKAGIPQAWTLTIEETFYFTAPLIFLLTRRGTVLTPCGLFLALAFVLGTVPFHGNLYHGELGHLLGRTLLGALPCFASGIVVAQLLLAHPERLKSNRWPLITYGALATVFALVLVLSRLGHAAESELAAGEIGRGRDYRHAWPLLFVLFPALVGLFFYGLLTERSLIKRALGSKLLVLLGGSSYCFYLIHIGVIQRLIVDYVSGNHLVLFVLLNVVALCVFECFEKPVGRWIKGQAAGGVARSEETQPLALARHPLAPYALLGLTLIAVFAWPEAVRWQEMSKAEAVLLTEDGIYESVEAVLCAAAAALFLVITFSPQRNVGARWPQRAWMLLLAVMLLLMLGEEVSWGQRLFNFHTPEWIAKQNTQGEFSLHNWTVFQPTDVGNRLQIVWLLGMLVYLGMLPLACVASLSVCRWIKATGIPLASVPLCVLFIGCMAFQIVRGGHSEPLELAIDLLLLALAVETLSALEVQPAEFRRTAAFYAATPAVVLAFALWYQAGRTELPSVTSMKLADQASADYVKGDHAAAVTELERAVAIWPQNFKARVALVAMLMELGRREEAIPHLEEILRLDPDRAEAHGQLAMIVADQGDYRRAVQELREALRLEPGNPKIASNLAFILAACKDDHVRDGKQAVQLAEQACQALDYGDPLAMNILGAAYAEAGRFSDAVETSQRAYDLAIKNADAGLATRIRDWQQLYLAGKPYRIGN